MKKKLLFIIWSNSYGGGAERQLTNLVNNLDKDKYEIDVIEYFHTNINPEKLASHINELKPINNKITESKIKRYIINKLIYKFPNFVRKIYIKKKYDLEVSFNYLIPTFLLSKSNDTKTVSWIHGAIWDIEKNKDPWLNRLQRESFKPVDKIVAIADATKKSITTIYPEYKEKTTIIYNGYDFDKMKKLANEEKIKKNSVFEIIYCNRFDENKNPLLLIEAAKYLKEKTDKFHINILGKGELEDSMKELIKKYKLEKNISILGYKKNPYPYIKNSDLVCVTSKTEGFSTLIIEGIYFGKPFISTSGGVTSEIRSYNIGLIADSPKKIANSIYDLMIDEEKYKQYSKKCKEVANNYSIKTQVSSAEKLFDTLLDS